MTAPATGTVWCLWEDGELFASGVSVFDLVSIADSMGDLVEPADVDVLRGLLEDIPAPADWAYRVTQHTVTPDGAA